jgi:hypothetical protein
MTCVALLACACASNPPPRSEEPPATSSSAAADPTGTDSDQWAPGKEGESCGDGMMGRPHKPCAEGLECDMTSVQPAAPPGAAGSTTFGTCRKAQ